MRAHSITRITIAAIGVSLAATAAASPAQPLLAQDAMQDAARTTSIAHAIGDARASVAAYFATRDPVRLGPAVRACEQIERLCSEMAAIDQATAEKVWLLGMRAGALNAMLYDVMQNGAPSQAGANEIWSRSIALRDSAHELSEYVATTGQAELLQWSFAQSLERDTEGIAAWSPPATPGVVFADDPVTTFFRAAGAMGHAVARDAESEWVAGVLPAFVTGVLGVLVGGAVMARRQRPSQAPIQEEQDISLEEALRACVRDADEIARCIESVRFEDAQETTRQPALFEGGAPDDRGITLERCVDRANLLALSVSIESSRDAADDRFVILAEELEALARDLSDVAASSATTPVEQPTLGVAA